MRTTIIALVITGVSSLSLSACQSTSPRPEIQASPAIIEHKAAKPVASIKPALPTHPPRYQIADQWQWSDGYGLKVSEVINNIATLQRLDAPKQWQRRNGLFKIESQSHSTHRVRVYTDKDPMQLFPLATGNSVVFRREYMANQQLRTHRTSWVVEGTATITVPAGRFPCWVLSRRSRSLTSDWTSYERWWYSPTVKNYVRMEYHYGDHTSGSRVLMNYRLAKTSS